MTRFAIAPPLPPLTPDRATDTRIQAERERIAPRGILGTTADAINSEWSTAWIGRLIGQSGFEEDPNYTIDEEEFKRLAEGLPEDMLGEFDNVRSPAHAEQIRSQLLDVADARQRLGQLGYVGGAARMIAAMTDPVDIAIGIAAGAATGGTGGVAAVATKADRIRRMVRAGLIGSAANLPNQALISSLDPQQGPVDVLYAAAGGFIGGNLGASFTGPAMSKLEAIGRQALVGAGTGAAVSTGGGLVQGDVDFGTIATATLLGGSLGTISSAVTNRLTQAGIRFRGDTEAGDVLQAAMGAAGWRERGMTLREQLDAFRTDKNGALSFRPEFDLASRQKTIESLVNSSGLDPVDDADTIAKLLSMDPDDALAELHGRLSFAEPDAEAAATAQPKFTSPDDPETPPKQAGDLDFTWVTDAKASLRWIRRSFASILGGSLSPEVRKLATAMADDALLKEDGTGSRIAASTWAHRETAKRDAGFTREFKAAANDWMREQKVPALERGAARERFANEVGEALRLPGNTFSDPHLKRAVKAARETFTDVLETAKRHGVRGLENVEPGDTYFTRVWLPNLVNKATAIHGNDALVELFRRGLTNLDRDVSLEDATAVARAMLSTIRDLDKYVDLDKARLAKGEAPELLRERLLAEGWDEPKIDGLLKDIGPRKSKGGDIGPAKFRTRLDETASVETPFGTLRLVDLMDSNVERVLPAYTRQLLGAAAATEMYTVIRGPDSPPLHTWKAASDALQTRMDRAGMKAEQIGKELALLNTLDKHVRGIPLLGDSVASRFLRRLRALNFIRLSGTFGFAQVPEMAGIVAEGGAMTMLNSLPAFRGVFKTVKGGGKLDNELLATLEAVTGLGTDRLLNRFHARNEWSDAADWAGTEVDRALHAGIKFSGDISGMAAINAMSQRFAAAAAVQKFWSYAQSGRTPSARRLASLGMTEKDAKQILSAMREEAKLQRGVKVAPGMLFGRRVANFDLEQWADQDAAAKFVDGIDRWSRRVIQTNDIGQMHPWMVTDLGRTLFQFRSFVAAAWEKQLLHRIQMRDWEAFSSMMAGTFTAGLVYAAQTYIQSLGREDRKEFLEEKLAPGAIARAAAARSAASSFTPGLFDTAAGLGDYGPYFNFRQSGLSSPLFSLDANPTVQFGYGIYNAGKGVFSAARDDRQLDQRDVAAITNLLPFQRTIGVNNVLRMFSQQFPPNDK